MPDMLCSSHVPQEPPALDLPCRLRKECDTSFVHVGYGQLALAHLQILASLAGDIIGARHAKQLMAPAEDVLHAHLPWFSC